MFFRKKKPDVMASPQEIARSLFGEAATVTAPLRCETAANYPFLAPWGTNAECDYYVQGTSGELHFAFSFPLKVYSSEREYRFHHYAFWGSCLTITGPAYRVRSAYAFSGKPFHAPENDTWFHNGKFKGLAVWSENRQLSESEMAAVKQVISWIESGISAMASPRYAVYFRQGTASVVFWQPELYDFESQLKMLRDDLRMM